MHRSLSSTVDFCFVIHHSIHTYAELASCPAFHVYCHIMFYQIVWLISLDLSSIDVDVIVMTARIVNITETMLPGCTCCVILIKTTCTVYSLTSVLDDMCSI